MEPEYLLIGRLSMKFNRACHPYNSRVVLTPNCYGVFVDPDPFDGHWYVHNYWIPRPIFKMRNLSCGFVEPRDFKEHKRGEGTMH